MSDVTARHKWATEIAEDLLEHGVISGETPLPDQDMPTEVDVNDAVSITAYYIESKLAALEGDPPEGNVMKKQRYIFPKNEKLKRHRFASRSAYRNWLYASCGMNLWAYKCHPVTTDPSKYPNEPCKRCES